MTLPWAMYSSRPINPAYAFIFSVPFFICLIDLLPIFKKPLINSYIGFFVLGLCTTCIMQLHMSWILLVPLTGLVFISKYKNNITLQLKGVGAYLIGLSIGLLTLVPTWLNDTLYEGNIGTNIVIKLNNWSNLPVIVSRLFSFSAYEIPYFLGTKHRYEIISDQIWMTPIMLFLLIVGFAQVGLFIYSFFIKNKTEGFFQLKILLLITIILLYFSFFFSIKGPSSHTFYILAPLPIFYSFYAYEYLLDKSKYTLPLLKFILLCGILFHIGLGLYNFQNTSLYTDRVKIVNALENMDYTILGTRRADEWGYGF
ncbi:MAG: hypothetical protein HRT72_04765 [Flavobacteriales bacterium]|nr:hypothetical protein [Flavobacteriales bacterium]